jgi:hypothetical protein
MVLGVSIVLAVIRSRIPRRHAEEVAELAIMRLGGAALPREFGDCVEDNPRTTSTFYDWLSPAERGTDIVFVSLRDSKPVRDKDIKILHDFQSLGMLDLSNTSITDACIADLAELRGLIWLDITRTGVSKAGQRRLRLSLPKCEILSDAGRRWRWPGPYVAEGRESRIAIPLCRPRVPSRVGGWADEASGLSTRLHYGSCPCARRRSKEGNGTFWLLTERQSSPQHTWIHLVEKANCFIRISVGHAARPSPARRDPRVLSTPWETACHFRPRFAGRRMF